MHYAYFPSARRLAVKQGSEVRVYDCGDNQIFGVSQQQGGDQSLAFTSQNGTVHVGDLKLVSSERADAPAAAPQTAAQPQAAAPNGANAAAPNGANAPATAPLPPGGAQTATDIFATLERLAELRQKNILSEEEFAAKKAELLARL